MPLLEVSEAQAPRFLIHVLAPVRLAVSPDSRCGYCGFVSSSVAEAQHHALIAHGVVLANTPPPGTAPGPELRQRQDSRYAKQKALADRAEQARNVRTDLKTGKLSF